MGSEPILVFVYNADSGLFNSIKDLLHKNFKPATYPCRLCAITYDNKGMISHWRQFVDDLGISVRFLHKDEFGNEFPDVSYDLPAAFIVENSNIRPIITALEMNGLNGRSHRNGKIEDLT